MQSLLAWAHMHISNTSKVRLNRGNWRAPVFLNGLVFSPLDVSRFHEKVTNAELNARTPNFRFLLFKSHYAECLLWCLHDWRLLCMILMMVSGPVVFRWSDYSQALRFEIRSLCRRDRRTCELSFRASVESIKNKHWCVLSAPFKPIDIFILWIV